MLFYHKNIQVTKSGEIRHDDPFKSGHGPIRLLTAQSVRATEHNTGDIIKAAEAINPFVI
jgi:hypothetical protein